jgi:hypothetical protein
MRDRERGLSPLIVALRDFCRPVLRLGMAMSIKKNNKYID